MLRYFDINYSFDTSKGFQLAFGMTAYETSGDDEGVIDPTYGRLVAKLKIWGE